MNNLYFSFCLTFLPHLLVVYCIRLPSVVVPIDYDLEIWTFLENFTFSGHVNIMIKCLGPISRIYLHSVNLVIDEVNVSIKNVSEDKQTIKKLENLDNFFVVETENEISTNETYSLFIPFSGELNDSLVGFYSLYLAKSEDWMAITRFKPIFARRAFPCFDEPSLRATFTIRLGHKDIYRAISNTDIEKVTNFSSHWVLTHFKKTNPISTYLVSFAVFNFDYQHCSSQNDVDIKIWTSYHKLNKISFACNITLESINFYKKQFSSTNVSIQTQFVVVPDLHGLEFEAPGLMTIREDVFLYDPNELDNKYKVVETISRNVARLWFGLSLQLQWWDNAWLLEGIVNYFGYRFQAFYFHSSIDTIMMTQRSFYFLDSFTSHPLSVPCDSEKEIFQSFDSFTIEKATYLVYMIDREHHTKTNLIWRDFLENTTSNLEAKLWEVIKKHVHNKKIYSTDVFFNSWTKQPGFPQIFIGHEQVHEVIFLQKRFLLQNDSYNMGACWFLIARLPILLENDEPFKSVLIPCAKFVDRDSFYQDQVVFMSYKSLGFYKVNYDKLNREIIFDLLRGNRRRRDILMQSNFVEDCLSFAAIDEVDYAFVVKLLKALSDLHSAGQIILYSVLPHFYSWLRLTENHPDYILVENFIESIFLPVYKRFLEDEVFRMMYPKIDIALTEFFYRFFFDLERQRDNYTVLLQSNLVDSNRHGPNAVSIYCNAVADSNEKDEIALFTKYLMSEVEAERNAIMLGLTCTKNIKRLIKFLKLTISETTKPVIRPYFFKNIFLKMVDNIGWPLQLRSFFYKKFPLIYSKWNLKENPEDLNAMLLSIAKQISTVDVFKEWQYFLNKNSQFMKNVYDLETANDIIEFNIYWISHIFKNLKNELVEELPVTKFKKGFYVSKVSRPHSLFLLDYIFLGFILLII